MTADPTASAPMKCLIIQPVHEDGLQLLRAAGIIPVICPDPSEATVQSLIGDCVAVITRDRGLSAASIRAGQALRVVVLHGAGHDVIDKEAATAHGVLVCNTPGANAQSVVELALGLSIAAARMVAACDHNERAGQHGTRERVRTTELAGKTALIVGFGTIGRGLAQILSLGLGMRVLVHSPNARDLAGFEAAPDLAAGLAMADLVSLHTPLRPETRHLIGAQTIDHFRPGAILVNTARAGLVDEEVLTRALETGRIAAAALDVYTETAPQGPLSRFPQVIFTPHMGGATQEALSRVARGSAGHVVQALSGIRPPTAVNDPAGWPGAN